MSYRWNEGGDDIELQKMRVMASWAVGWMLRQFIRGVFMGLGAWVGFAIIGARIVCK